MKPTRPLSLVNHQRFKTALSQLSWLVLGLQDVNQSFESFWNTFKDLFDLHFPVTFSKPNRNTHKITPYMTAGLLISRQTKNRLYVKSVANPSVLNITTYKKNRNIYNSLLRRSRKLYYTHNLHMFRNNPKKPGKFLRK
jgi:hypothetical protein